MNYLIILYNGQRAIARYSFADQRMQMNAANYHQMLRLHPTATAWEFLDANPKRRTT